MDIRNKRPTREEMQRNQQTDEALTPEELEYELRFGRRQMNTEPIARGQNPTAPPKGTTFK